MLGHDCLDLDLLELVALENDVAVVLEHDGPEVHLAALVSGQPLDEQLPALLGAVLLAAGLDYRVARRHRRFLVALRGTLGLCTRTAPAAPSAAAPSRGR